MTLIISTTSCVGGGAGHGNESTKNSPPSLSKIRVTSNNTDQNLAEPGNTITVTFTASESMNGHKILINGNEAVITHLSGKSYKADYTLTTSESEGEITIKLVLSNSNPKTLSVDNNNSVTIVNMPPATPSAITLKVPSSSPAWILTPEFTVTGIEVGATVEIFSDACTTSIGSAVASATTIDVTSSALSLGTTYTIYAQQTDEDGNISACSSNTASYELKQPFVSSWDTTAPNEIITLPLRPGYTYTMNVDWGDGSPIAEITSDSDGDKIHTYVSTGTYTITLSGIAETLYFNNTSGDKDKIKTISNLGDMGWTTFEGAFAGCFSLTTVNGGVTSNVISMRRMFNYAGVATPDTSDWDTSNVTDMYSMFHGASNATPNTSGWNTSNVTTMNRVFRGASSANPDTSNWDTSNITSMEAIFAEATSANPDTSTWDISNATSMDEMFKGATNADPNTSAWDTSNITDMSHMFSGASSATPDTSGWNTSNVTIVEEAFRNASIANPDTSNWNTSNITFMYRMFLGATSTNPDTSTWDTSNVTNMNSMFSGAANANPNTSSWDISNVTDMISMFYNAINANPDTSGWNTSNIAGMTTMFTGVTLPTTDYSNFLILLESQNSNASVSLDGGNSEYSAGAAAAARAALISDHGWTIIDGGQE